jgi:hypothetical protein
MSCQWLLLLCTSVARYFYMYLSLAFSSLPLPPLILPPYTPVHLFVYHNAKISHLYHYVFAFVLKFLNMPATPPIMLLAFYVEGLDEI